MKNIKNISLFLLMYLFIILLGSSIFFIFKISIKNYFSIIFFIITSLFFIKYKKLNVKENIKIIIISLLIIIFSLLISCFMFDRSSDGNTYHKDAVGVLKEGFNPYYDEASTFIFKRDNSSKLNDYSIWINHYAKANWIIEANFYSLTNNIESAKAINIISIIILFGFIYSSLNSILDKKKSFILSIVSVLNPITASQIFTFYNDQLVLIYLFLSILYLIKLENNIFNKEYFLIYSLSFIILFNTKFNGCGYLLVFSFIFALKYLVNAYKNKKFTLVFNKLFIRYILLFTISIFIVGIPTYVRNFVDHNNMFYPLYDSNGEDIITEQEPKKFVNNSNLYKLFYATFSKANNLRDNDLTTLKIPFTIYKSEIKPLMSNDLRISGWGVFFSGLLIISIIIFIKYKNKLFEHNIFFTLLISILLLLTISESWWARYTPFFYLFILFSLFILYKYNNKKIINYIYTLLIIINTLIPLIGNTYYTFINSININNELNSFKNKKINIKETEYNGILYNLKDYNISYKFNNNIKTCKLYYNYLERECK